MANEVEIPNLYPMNLDADNDNQPFNLLNWGAECGKNIYDD